MKLSLIIVTCLLVSACGRSSDTTITNTNINRAIELCKPHGGLLDMGTDRFTTAVDVFTTCNDHSEVSKRYTNGRD